MAQQIFKSQHPILEACMNQGSSLQLAIAVHRAGGYASLSSWAYGTNFDQLQKDIDMFMKFTKSNRLHCNFEIRSIYSAKACRDIVIKNAFPTMEIVYGNSNSAPAKDDIPDATVIEWLQPIHEAGVKIFRRIYEPMDKATADKHFIDGFCIKGLESAGFSGYTPVKELFLAQKELTPDAYLVPYGGVGTPEQVKEYIDLGAEIVAVGTLLALSAESPIKQATKLAVINAKKEDLSEFNHTFRRNGDTEVVRKQTALKFKEFQGTDNVNHTESLKYGLWKEDTDQGHIYAGHSIDKVTEVLPCKKIIQNLVAEL